MVERGVFPDFPLKIPFTECFLLQVQLLIGELALEMQVPFTKWILFFGVLQGWVLPSFGCPQFAHTSQLILDSGFSEFDFSFPEWFIFFLSLILFASSKLSEYSKGVETPWFKTPDSEHGDSSFKSLFNTS